MAMPVHVNENHWILAVYDNDVPTISVYDSLGGTNNYTTLVEVGLLIIGSRLTFSRI